MSRKVEFYIALVLHALAAAAIIYLLTPYGAAITQDSIAYLDIAQHIQSGQGLRGTDYSLFHYGEHQTLPGTAWPPLYPALLAATGFPPTVYSAALLAFILLSITLFFVYLTLRNFIESPFTIFVSLPLAVTTPIITVYSYAWSEQLFIMLITILVWSTQEFLISKSAITSRRLIYLVTSLLIALFYTRYLGLVLFTILPALYLSKKGSSQLLKHFIICSVFYAMTVVALLIHNLVVSGSLTGASRSSSDIPFLGHFINLFFSLALFVYSAKSIVAVLGISIFITMVLAVIISKRSFSLSITSPNKSIAKTTLVVTAGIAIYYSISIIGLRFFVQFDDIDIRLISGITPLIWIFAIAMIFSSSDKTLNLGIPVVPIALLVVMTVNGYFSILDTRENWRTYGSPILALGVASPPYMNLNPSPTKNEIKRFYRSLMNENSVLVITKPSVHQFLTGITSVEMNQNITEVEVQKLITMPEKSLLVLTHAELQPVAQQLARYNIALRAMSTNDSYLIYLPLHQNPTTN